jgi:hypothetical protein
MYHPHAFDERVAEGFANYENKEKTMTDVSISSGAFRAYMEQNYLNQLDKEALLEMLVEVLPLEDLVVLAREIWDLPFAFEEDGSVAIEDVEQLLVPDYNDPLDDDDDCGCDEWQEDDEHLEYTGMGEDMETLYREDFARLVGQ